MIICLPDAEFKRIANDPKAKAKIEISEFKQSLDKRVYLISAILSTGDGIQIYRLASQRQKQGRSFKTLEGAAQYLRQILEGNRLIPSMEPTFTVTLELVVDHEKKPDQKAR